MHDEGKRNGNALLSQAGWITIGNEASQLGSLRHVDNGTEMYQNLQRTWGGGGGGNFFPIKAI